MQIPIYSPPKDLRLLNSGYAVAILGVLGIIVGAAFYAMDWHRTIGEGGIGLGAVLLLVGIWLSRQPPAKASQPGSNAPASQGTP